MTVSVRRGGEQAFVSVHNSGNPIAAGDQGRIFEPFARTSAAEAGSQLGWGLGLTLVRGCVEAHGGTIEVVSNAEAGTTFSILLPLDSRAAPRKADGPSSMPPLEIAHRRAAPAATGGSDGAHG